MNLINPNVHRYEIVKVNLPNHRGTCWTVIEYVKEPDLPETCHGGDQHWLFEMSATVAKVVYENDPSLHGKIWNVPC